MKTNSHYFLALFVILLFWCFKLCTASGGDTLKFPTAYYLLKDGDVFYTDLHYKAPHDSTQKIINGRLGNKNIASDAMIDPMKLDTSKTIYLRKIVLDTGLNKALYATDTGYILKLGTSKVWSNHLSSQGAKILNDTSINLSVQNLNSIGTALFNGISNNGTIGTNQLNADSANIGGLTTSRKLGVKTSSLTHDLTVNGSFKANSANITNDTNINLKTTTATADSIKSTAITTARLRSPSSNLEYRNSNGNAIFTINGTNSFLSQIDLAVDDMPRWSIYTDDVAQPLAFADWYGNLRLKLDQSGLLTTFGIANTGTITTDSLKVNNGIRTRRAYCDSIKIDDVWYSWRTGTIVCTTKTLDMTVAQYGTIGYAKFGKVVTFFLMDVIEGTATSSGILRLYANFKSITGGSDVGPFMFPIPMVITNATRMPGIATFGPTMNYLMIELSDGSGFTEGVLKRVEKFSITLVLGD